MTEIGNYYLAWEYGGPAVVCAQGNDSSQDDGEWTYTSDRVTRDGWPELARRLMRDYAVPRLELKLAARTLGFPEDEIPNWDFEKQTEVGLWRQVVLRACHGLNSPDKADWQGIAAMSALAEAMSRRCAQMDYEELERLVMVIHERLTELGEKARVVVGQRDEVTPEAWYLASALVDLAPPQE